MGSRRSPQAHRDLCRPPPSATSWPTCRISACSTPRTATLGRPPADHAGLKLFVNTALLEVGNLSDDERESIEARCATVGRSVTEALEQATTLLSGLSRCAGVVMAPKTEQPLKHIEFVNLGPGRALVVTVTQSGHVENRVIDTPVGMPPSALVEATNYLNARLIGRTIEESRRLILEDLKLKRAELDDLTARVIESGMATWAGEPGSALIDAPGTTPRHHRLKTLSACATVRCAGARASFVACSISQRGVRRADLHGPQSLVATPSALCVAPFRIPGGASGRHRRQRPDASEHPHHPAVDYTHERGTVVGRDAL